MADALATVGGPKFSVNGGYIYTTYNPYTLFDQPLPPPTSTAFYVPRNEISLGASSNWGRCRFSGWTRRDLQTNQMVGVGADAVYEDECYIMDFRFYRRYTTYNGDHGSTTLLIQLTFKTIGQFGFRRFESVWSLRHEAHPYGGICWPRCCLAVPLAASVAAPNPPPADWLDADRRHREWRSDQQR